MRILIAEDDLSSRKLLTGLLKKWGHELVVAVDGATALQLFAADRTIQMAILDWMMPGISGLEVCRTIKATCGDHLVYVIMLTARSQKEDLVQAFEDGADDYVTKPFAAAELRVRVTAGERLVASEESLQKKIHELQEALTHVKQLQNILPMCAWCRRIRDDDDYWRSVEEYMMQHSMAKFSHGICPDCRKQQMKSLADAAVGTPENLTIPTATRSLTQP